MIRPVVHGASLLFAGLFAGFLLGVLVFELSLRGFDAGVYTQTQQVTLIALPALAAALLLPAIAGTATVTAQAWRERGAARLLPAIALLLLVAALLVTMIVNIPINLAEAQWSVDSPPHDWATRRDLWQIGHAVRTAAAALAFAALIGATLVRRRAGEGRGLG